MEQTPWEILKSFLREYDHKDGNYIEIKLGNKIKLRKNPDESITVYDLNLESLITCGRCNDEARILIKGKIENDYDVLNLELKSASNIILSKRKYRGPSYYSIELSYYKEDGHKIRLLITEPGSQSMNYFINNIIYKGEVYDVEDLQCENEDLDRKDEIDLNPNCDLKRVIIQEGSVKKMDKN